ncbi:MAG: GspH/FimT family pseudopilin [Chromatiales bacterium]|nr:GspH/FimT family pseudopilin [Chromatiales bacterium]
MDKPASSQRGFTLIELVIALTIAGILLAIAVPTFQALQANATVTSEVNHVVHYLHLARSEAIKQGQNSVLCASADGERCNQSTEWQHGFIVFADLNKNRQHDSDEPLLAHHQPNEARITILSSTSEYGRKTIVYLPSGMGSGSTATMEFCDPAKIGAAKAVILSNTGRPRVAEKRPDGSKISCG